MALAVSLIGIQGVWAQTASKTRPGNAGVVASHELQADDTYRYASSPAAMSFAREVAERRQLDEAWTLQLVAKAERLDRAIKLVTPAPSGKAKNWAAYRDRFIEPTRIEAGKQFWLENREVLQQVEHSYGVPASLIVGVLGVETLYGRHTGGFRVIDALTTLAFDFPDAHPRYSERRAFFRGELEQFLLMTSQNGLDPLAIEGSYAGAMGLPQFMPSSWRRYGVDYDHDGKVDLFNSPADIVASVANYFRNFGWRPGVPTHYEVSVRPGKTDLQALLAPDIVPSFSPASMQKLGAGLGPQAKSHEGPLALIELENGEDARTYYAGTDNFFAVTRYNWSSYYAMAVIELGKAVEARLPPG
ncbi:hypothetical protein NBRC116584_32900 [Hydrogenophaga sp. 5NK40-0174]